MKIKGIIKQICQDRTFTKRDGSQETAREIVFNAPYFKANGETSSNNFIGTHFGTFDRNTFEQMKNQNRECEFEAFFDVREHEGRYYQTCKLSRIGVIL